MGARAGARWRFIMHDPISHQHPARVSATLAPSLLRLSVMQRIVIAVMMSAILWIAVGWALSGISS
ncbi:MAG TPA: hypothetical protein VMN03_07810 [Burkholderiales bacterium]|nr:hypothetical protein [Burkholderiales bacterium]